MGGCAITILTSAMETKETVEVADDLWEPIPIEEFQVEPQQGVVFARTHDAKVNEFTYAEAKLLLQVAQAEAGNQGEDGMWLVLSVIFNRMKSDNADYHPKGDHSVEGVIYKKYAFASVWDGRYLEVEISPEAHLALARIEKGEVAPNIIAFETLESVALDEYFDEVFDYKDHKFYVEKEDE